MFAEGGYFLGGMHFLWWILWLLVVGGIVFYVWWRPGEARRSPCESAPELLQRRMASGDITAEEYEKRKVLLDRAAPSKTWVRRQADIFWRSVGSSHDVKVHPCDTGRRRALTGRERTASTGSDST